MQPETGDVGAGLSIDIGHVAELVRLELTPEEAATFGRQLARVLDYVAQLQRLQVDDVEPTAHAVPVLNVLREDEPRPGLNVEETLGNAPLARQHLFIVPRIIE